MIDKKVSLQLKGLSIILIIICHLVNYRFLTYPLSYSITGQWGVAVFLMLSGYGLTISYLQKGLKNFLEKRFLKVFLPYFIVTLISIIADVYIFNINYKSSVIISSLVGFDLSRTIDPSMWYITYIFLWYFIFYGVFSLPLNKWLKVVILLSISCLIYFGTQLIPHTEKVIWHWTLYPFVFPIGSILAVTKPSKIIYYCLGGAGIIGLTYTMPHIGIRPFFMLNIISVAFIMIAILLFVRFKPLELIGKISFEIYLLESILMTKYNVLIFESLITSLFVYAFILVLLSLLLHILINSTYDKLKSIRLHSMQYIPHTKR